MNEHITAREIEKSYCEKYLLNKTLLQIIESYKSISKTKKETFFVVNEVMTENARLMLANCFRDYLDYSNFDEIYRSTVTVESYQFDIKQIPSLLKPTFREIINFKYLKVHRLSDIYEPTQGGDT